MNALPGLRQLRYLVALDDARHFGRAAKNCHVTQSTLSAGIKELETQLGVTLVDRSRRRAALTALGAEAVLRARRMLAEAADLVEAMRGAAEPLTGTLRLGVIPTVGPFLLPRTLPGLRRAFPRLKLYLTEDLTERLVDQLEAGRLDAVVLALPCDCGPIEVHPLFEDRFSLALRPDHSLAHARRISRRQLEGQTLLLLADGHCLRAQALEACALVDNRAHDSFAATSLHTLVQMVENGLGITLLPALAIEAGILKGTQLTTRPLEGAAAHRIVGLGWRKGSPRTAEFALLGRWLARHQTQDAALGGKRGVKSRSGIDARR
ncbi:MAG: hydrogen peroxide-inducible genes activator [Alphaproteobacteria bacterium]|nr:hydrogen peroxide-inducible genes activator [Alphaproteobacteria bacterium]